MKFDLDYFISVKKLEKGLGSIFVPHSPGVYVCISLNKIDQNDDFDCDNKYYRCNTILDLEALDVKTRELLLYFIS